jgi:Retinal pigment epithelial membrane protein
MEAFSIATALAAAVQGRALNVPHLLPTGHNPVRDAVSDYGVGPQQILNDRTQEFPRVDDRVISRPHQYGYSAMIGEVSPAISPLTGDFADEAFTSALLRHDLTHGTAETHDFGQHATAGEPCSLPPRPARPKTTAMSSPRCTTPTAALLTWPPRRPGLHRGARRACATCQPGSRSDFTVAGSLTTITGVIGSGRQGRRQGPRPQAAARRPPLGTIQGHQHTPRRPRADHRL